MSSKLTALASDPALARDSLIYVVPADGSASYKTTVADLLDQLLLLIAQSSGKLTIGSGAGEALRIQTPDTNKDVFIIPHGTGKVGIGSETLDAGKHTITGPVRIAGTLAFGNIGAGPLLEGTAIGGFNNFTGRVYGGWMVDTLGAESPHTPASAAASGARGRISWDNDYIYICIANNTWKRVAISTW